MKDKLIKLIGEVQDKGKQQRGMGTFHIRNEEVADHLIENGVTLPILCGECAHSTDSRSVDCAYKCTLKRSPCYGRTTYADFGCLYGERRSDG